MDKNVLVLTAISGDQESFQKVYERLQTYAYSIASELFSDSVIREDAIIQAMDEVLDKIKNQRAMFENKPLAYVKRSVSNSLIDLARLREASKLKEENAASKSCEKPLDPKELAWIDEGFATITNDGDNDSGFRIFKISDVPQNAEPVEKKSKNHPWIDILEQVLTFQWWWGIEEWEENKSKILPTKESLTSEDLAFRFKYCSEKMWAKWNLINGLLDNIASPTEKRIMLQQLSGFKQIDIAQKQNVSEPYISKVLAKYRKDWGWNEDDMRQAKLMLLSKHLADWYAAPKKYDPQTQNSPYSFNLEELHFKLSRARYYYEQEFLKLNPGWEFKYHEDDKKTYEKILSDKIRADWIAKVKRYGLKTAVKMYGGMPPVETRWKSHEERRPDIRISLELEAIEANIENLQMEIFYFNNPQLYENLTLSYRLAMWGIMQDDFLEVAKRKYWDTLSASKGSLDIIFPKTREAAKQLAIWKFQWELENEFKVKTQEGIIKTKAEFEQNKSEFYKTLTSSVKMKAYFYDLDLTDIVQLNRIYHIAEAFFRSWYPYACLNKSPDYGYWLEYPVRKDYS